MYSIKFAPVGFDLQINSLTNAVLTFYFNWMERNDTVMDVVHKKKELSLDPTKH